jgi:epoxyqueuosine reductase QueG
MDPLTESFKIISVLTVASFRRTTTVCPSGSLKAADVSMGQPAVMHISPTLDITSPIKREKAIDNRFYDDGICHQVCRVL